MAKIVTTQIDFPSADGSSTCRGLIWKASRRKARAIIQIVHGMTEHIGRYGEFAGILAERGWVVCAIDQLGHGTTSPEPEQRGAYDPKQGANHLIEDQRTLLELMQERYPGVPHVMVAHSMGSFVARCCAARFGDELDGVVLLGTGWMPRNVISANRTILSTLAIVRGWNHRSPLIDKMGIGGYNKRFAAECEGEPLGTEWVSRDPERVAELAADPDCHFVFTLSGYYTVMVLMREAEDELLIGQIPKSLPMLIASGTDDPVGNFGEGPTQLARVLEDAGLEDVTLELIEGARHELVNEVNRDEIIAGIIDWIDSHALA